MLPEVGATELLVIAAIALIVVGPKDLPVLLRRLGKFVAHMRAMANEFRSSFDELARQSELEELRKEVEAMRQAAHEPVTAAANAVGADSVMREIGSSLADRLEPELSPLAGPQFSDAPAQEPPAAEKSPNPKPRKARASRAKAPSAPTEPSP